VQQGAAFGFEPTISAGRRSQTYALDRAATGTGSVMLKQQKSRDYKHDISVTRFVASYFKTLLPDTKALPVFILEKFCVSVVIPFFCVALIPGSCMS